MEELKKLIMGIRRQNAEYRWFVPHQALDDLMTEDMVQKAIREIAIELYHIRDLTRVIMDSARKIFAILILIGQPQSVMSFVEDDQLQYSSLDHKLPFQLDKLRTLLSSLGTPEQFHERQWEFTAPVFTGSVLPRVLEGEVILPFLESREVGEGGFGVVHIVKVERSHQKFGQAAQQELVRKEFRPRSTSKAEYEMELRNLSILKLLKHPHIVELLGCYTYRDKHHFLFPLARGGTLASLLAGERFNTIQTDENLIIALCGLSSALGAVHEFVSDDFRAIGCHHDLKPTNILVDDSKFLLADFGLSRFKELPQVSDTSFKGGRGDYVAPECEDLEDAFEKHAINRSSDIWSFGCILSEFLTYMTMGAEGVRNFKNRRVFKVANFKFFRFHCGPGNQNKAVIEQLADIEKVCSRSGRSLAQLAKRMLSLSPGDRPTITEVDARLRFIAVDAIVQPVDISYGTVCKGSKSILALVEQGRFASWKGASGIFDDNSPNEPTSFLRGRSYFEFQMILIHLLQLRETLKAIKPECQNPRSRLFLPLRHLNNTLLGALPRELQESALTHLEYHLLQTQDLDILGNLSETLQQGLSPDSQIGMLAAIKRTHILVAGRSAISNPKLEINPKDLHGNENLEDFYMRRLVTTEGEGGQRVLVEWKNYGDHFADKTTADKLFVRLEAVADLLNSAHQRKPLRVLHCCGFYHDPAHHAFGLVYEFPHSSAPGDEELSAITLRTVLDNDPNHKRLPVLGDRFRLAHSLAASVLEFHKIHWLQKGISSFNIVFFHSRTSSWEKCMDALYFLGFLRSRQDDEFAFTEGLEEDSKHKDYQHPEYLRSGVRFRPEFDYYSLGIVLLELGLWKSLSNMTKDWHCSPEEFRERLLQRRVPHLGPAMGVTYRDAVSVCLRGDFEVVSELKNGSSLGICLSFKCLVVDKLATCKA